MSKKGTESPFGRLVLDMKENTKIINFMVKANSNMTMGIFIQVILLKEKHKVLDFIQTNKEINMKDSGIMIDKTVKAKKCLLMEPYLKDNIKMERKLAKGHFCTMMGKNTEES